MLPLPGVLKRFSEVFVNHGYQCYLVGGAIRDLLSGRRSTDFDIATDALPLEVQRMFHKVIPTGIKHGTVTVLFHETRFEVTTFRIDQEYLDGRRPDAVLFSPSIEEDLKRRDFTINAIAYDLIDRKLLDPHDGRGDLKRGIIRAIGDPLERFLEDGLRPLRACRFAAQFRFLIDPPTFAAIPLALDNIRKVSAERMREELVRLLQAEEPSEGFRLMRSSGLLTLILPELDRCAGVEQGELHCFDVFEHSLRSCDAAPAANLEVRLAALLHDLGKPASLRRDAGGGLSFHGHEQLAAETAGEILRRLRFANDTIQRTVHLVRHHMFNYQEQWSAAAVRRFVARVGEHNIPDLLALRRADQVGMCGDASPSPSLAAFQERIEAVLAGARALTLKDLAVNGKDIMAALALSSGPHIGLILSELMESVLGDPELNTKETLLKIARRFYEERLRGAP